MADTDAPSPTLTVESPINAMEITVRSYHALENMGIETVGQLVKHSVQDLLKTKNCGAVTLLELVTYLAEHGLQFKSDYCPRCGRYGWRGRKPAQR